MDGTPPLVDRPPRSKARGQPLSVGVVLGVCAAAYVVLRLQLNQEYGGASWQALVDLSAPLPYGHRILAPLLARPLVAASVPLPWALGIVEWLAVVGLVVSVKRTLANLMPGAAAWVFGFAVLFVLPFAYLLQHRWPIFYPWDTPAMLFTALAVDLAVRRRMVSLIVVTAVAALNRETAILIPIIVIAMEIETVAQDARQLRRLLAWSGLMLVAYVLVRQSVAIALPDNAGAPIRWVVEGQYRIVSNLQWLSDPAMALRFFASLGLLPLLWLALRRHVPADVQRLHIPALGLGCGLLFVANAYEPRAFGEVIILCWLAVAAAAWRLMTDGSESTSRSRPRWLTLLDRGAAVTIVLLAAVAALLVARLPPPG